MFWESKLATAYLAETVKTLQISDSPPVSSSLTFSCLCPTSLGPVCLSHYVSLMTAQNQTLNLPGLPELPAESGHPSQTLGAPAASRTAGGAVSKGALGNVSACQVQGSNCHFPWACQLLKPSSITNISEDGFLSLKFTENNSI